MKLIFGISVLNSRFVALLCLQAAALSASLAWAQSPAPGDAAQTTQSPPTYSVTDLGTYSGAIQMGINDKGQVAFTLQTSDFKQHPFLWQDGKITDLGTLGGNDARALSINNKDQVVGHSDTGPGAGFHAFLWQNGRMMDLGTLKGGTTSEAYAINDKGQVVGSSDSAQTIWSHPFLWQNGRMVDLGTLGGSNGLDAASAINNQGQVVGWSLTPKGKSDAFLWENGHLTDIIRATSLAVIPTGINQRGHVAGYTTTITGDAHAFLWQNGRITNLGPGVAFGSNDNSQVVGGLGPGGGPGAGLWQEGKVFDLNTLVPPASGWNLGIASAINNLGQIVGSGIYNGEGRYFLLTPQVDATLQLSHASWRFAAHPVGQPSGPGTIWVQNSGPQPVHFSGIQFTGANAQDFAVTESTCGSTLAASTVCKLVFHFTPTAAGQRNASLTLNDNAKDGSHAIPVQGFGSSK